MMFGMFGIGWLMMLLIVGLPILVVLLVIAGTTGFLQHRVNSNAGYQYHPTVSYPSVNHNSIAPARFCIHCGAGLNSDWTHCPQCGAPIQ